VADTKHFLLRLDPRLFEALRRWADDDLRSINAQIEYLLTDQARRAGRLPHRRRKPPQPPKPAGPEEDVERAPSRRRVPAATSASRGSVS
jgi:hypothetical protein